MRWVKNWKELIKKREKEDGENFLFGYNCFWGGNQEVIKYFSKLEKLGATVELDSIYWESIKVHLPSLNGPSAADRDAVLLFVLTTTPTPTNVVYRKNVLMLEWS